MKNIVFIACPQHLFNRNLFPECKPTKNKTKEQTKANNHKRPPSPPYPLNIILAIPLIAKETDFYCLSIQQVALNERPRLLTEAETEKREAETQAEIIKDKANSDARILQNK